MVATLELLETIFATTRLMVAYLDPDFNFIRVNRAYAEADHRPPEFFIGKNHFDLYPDPENQAIFRRVVESGEPYFARAKPFIYPHDPGRGMTYWDWSLQPVKEANGRIKALIFSLQDVTEHKLAEQKIALLNLALDHVRESAFLIDEQARFRYVNEEACRILGYTRDELLRLGVMEVDPDWPEEKWPLHWAALKEHGSLTFEGRHRTKEGRSFPVEVNANYFEHEGRSYNLALVRDISERKQAEEERLAHLRFFTNMDRIHRAIQGARDLDSLMSDVLDEVLAIFACDRAYLLSPCDPEAETCRVPMERTRPEYPGAGQLNLAIPIDSEVRETIRTLRQSEGPVKFGPGCEHPLPTRVAENFGIKSFMATALYPKVGQPWQFGIHQCSSPRIWTPKEETLFQEIGRRLSDGLTSWLSYRDLLASEKRLAEAQRIAHIGSWELDLTSKSLTWSDEIFRIFELDPRQFGASYDAFLDIVHPEDREMVDRAYTKSVADHRPYNIEHRLLLPEGRVKHVHERCETTYDDQGRPLRSQGTVQEITERKKLEEQLTQAQKMEAVGRLAGGVAHDFNNMLNVILGHAEMGLMKITDATQPLIEDLQEILTAANRSAVLTRQLLAFARKQTVTPKILDLNETVEGMLKMLRLLIGEEIELAWLPTSTIWPVMMDPSQIDQLLANLCVNARDAIESVGKISIETRNATIDEIYGVDHPEAVVGDYVLLAVSDNGCGMDRQTLTMIFEPFFTTKEMGKGTGLGLATVYGIVKQNNGFINVYSEPGHGSTFKLYLPRHITTNEEVPTEIPAAQAPGGDETILLVEDDPAILGIARLLLERLGYRVLTAATPGEAIVLAQKHRDELQLLLTDVIMPEMNGSELARQLEALSPHLKILFMSGYTGDVIVQHGVLKEGVHFIPKPFSLQTLAVKIREVLTGLKTP